MRCTDVKPLISAFHDGELGRSEQEAVRSHLLDCAACRRDASELRSISRWLSPEDAPAVSPGFTDSVMARLRAGELLEETSEAAARRSFVWIAAAAAVVLATGGLFLSMPARGGNFASGTLDAALNGDVEREIERNNILARESWRPAIASPRPTVASQPAGGSAR
jgi:anti-sigma factor RsiW